MEKSLELIWSALLARDLTKYTKINPAISCIAGFVPGHEESEKLVPHAAKTAANLIGVRERTTLGMHRDSEGLMLHLLDVKGPLGS